MKIILRRRFRGALVVAVAATIAALLLAIGPNWRGRYDPNLALLAATLIAVVWYTFFNYCALHRDELGRLGCRLQNPRERTIELLATNGSRYRTLRGRVRVLVQRAGQAMALPATLSGDLKEEFTLLPGETRTLQFRAW